MLHACSELKLRIVQAKLDSQIARRQGDWGGQEQRRLALSTSSLPSCLSASAAQEASGPDTFLHLASLLRFGSALIRLASSLILARLGKSRLVSH